MNLKEWFDSLPPGTKKGIIYGVVGVVTLVGGLNLYHGRQGTVQNTAIHQETLDKDLLKKTELAESRRHIEELSRQIEHLQQEQTSMLEKMKSGKTDGGVPGAPAPGTAAAGAGTPGGAPGTPVNGSALPTIPNAAEVEARGQHFPPPQGAPGQQQNAGSVRQGQSPAGRQREERKTIGDIQVLSNTGKKDTSKDKKNERTVYLPPSFMSAVLLTGMDAGTSSSGKTNPDPMLFRVQTPAILPNDVKSNLAGCFVVGEGQGRLDRERVDVRLVSLACLTREGTAVIDTTVKGFVTDADAKTGLAGHVVSKMGAAVARSLVAGVFQGAGDMIKQESTSTSTSALGTVSTIEPSKVGTYALGSGVSSGANRLADFYLTLAKQATPVIEANAGKHVTVVITEGKELVIKSLPQQEELNDED